MRPSGIITLTTDFGITDPYVAMMKGVILTVFPNCQIVDISHKINVGAVSHAALLIRETFPFFPDGTVHTVVVDPGVGSERGLLGIKLKSHYFVGPDNGLFWPLVENDEEALIVQLTENKYFLPTTSQTFHGRDVFAPVAAHLSKGADLLDMGPVIEDIVRLDLPMPREEDGILFGRIVRVDNFGNLITNISREDLTRFLGPAQPLFKAGSLRIRKLRRFYSDNDEGEAMALINSSNMLELAVNLGRASEYIGIDRREIIGSTVRVEKD